MELWLILGIVLVLVIAFLVVPALRAGPAPVEETVWEKLAREKEAKEEQDRASGVAKDLAFIRKINPNYSYQDYFKPVQDPKK